jgi:chromosome segregation ATPase
MAMTPQELQEWELRLKRDQEKWHTTSSELERKVTRLNAEIDVLKGDLSTKQAVHDTLSAETDQLAEKHTSVINDLAASEAKIAKLMTRETALLDQVKDLDEVIAAKKADIDKDVESYGARRRREVELSLATESKKLDEIAAAIGEMEIVLETRREALTQLIQDAADARSGFAKETDEQNRWMESQAAKKAEMKADIEAVDKELKALYYKRDDVIATTSKAQARHDQFVAYEKEATKILQAKDRELQERQAELSVNERHLETRRSFLPPL